MQWLPLDLKILSDRSTGIILSDISTGIILSDRSTGIDQQEYDNNTKDAILIQYSAFCHKYVISRLLVISANDERFSSKKNGNFHRVMVKALNGN